MKRALAIKNTAKKLGLNNFHCILAKIEYYSFVKLKKLLGNKKIDSINFDSCGSLNNDVAMWLHKLVKSKLIKKGSIIAFNFNMNGRGNNMLISHYIKLSTNNKDVYGLGYGFKEESLDILKASKNWKNGIPNKNNKNFNLRYLAHLDIILDIFYGFYNVKIKNTLFYRAYDSKTNMGTYIIEVN